MSFEKVAGAIITPGERERDLFVACNEVISVKLLLKEWVKQTMNMNENTDGCSAANDHNFTRTK